MPSKRRPLREWKGAAKRYVKSSDDPRVSRLLEAASAGESLAAGVIFTIPALLLIGYWDDFNYLEIAKIAAIGGVIGVLFTIVLPYWSLVGESLTP